ncbi:MAG: NADH-quinone oxidoreductase subunit L [Myxococcales bacterium]|nr:NADH-quinone oxidoreductase subunit L [Myxococcales bacterium]
MSPISLALVALLVPFGMALLLVLAAPLRRAGWPAAWLSVLAAAISLGASLSLLAHQVRNTGSLSLLEQPWLPHAGRSLVTVGVQVDGISASMAVIVTLVAFCVQVFSLGYMAAEPKADLGRYFTYHSLFIFSMLALVFAPNMLQFFAGWELVGLTSYLLIGFYYRKPSAARAAVKAFWITKFADMGLLLGVILLFAATGGFSWEARVDPAAITLLTLLIFVGVMGKSAQFPLHVWLPDAMEGPTPVSALLHAATMVAAGVYLLVRASPLFAQAELTLEVMTWIGAITAFGAACIALVQTDIKKVLAYSTCSQLGYMVAALGAGSVLGGFFHLMTHAFFKALLFLGAGAVIHAVHSNELSAMGGLWRKLPLTAITFIIAALALAGFPGLAGFFSKDLILEAIFEEQRWGPYALLMAAAFLTAFYMSRVVFLAFFGAPSEAASRAQPSPWSMRLPLIVLAIPSLGAGLLAWSFAELQGLPYQLHLGPTGLVASVLGLSGIVLAYLVYARRSIPLSAFASLAPIGASIRSAPIDRLYQALYAQGALRVAALIAYIDRYLIDGLMNLSAWLTIVGGRRLRQVQTGNVRDYVLVLVGALILLSAWSVIQ